MLKQKILDALAIVMWKDIDAICNEDEKFIVDIELKLRDTSKKMYDIIIVEDKTIEEIPKDDKISTFIDNCIKYKFESKFIFVGKDGYLVLKDCNKRKHQATYHRHRLINIADSIAHSIAKDMGYFGLCEKKTWWTRLKGIFSKRTQK